MYTTHICNPIWAHWPGTQGLAHERRQVEGSVLSTVTVRKGRPSHCPLVSVKACGTFTQWVNSKAARMPGKPRGARTARHRTEAGCLSHKHAAEGEESHVFSTFSAGT